MKNAVVTVVSVAGALTICGCVSGMYSSELSVEKMANGEDCFTVVSELPVGVQYTGLMPVVVSFQQSSRFQTSMEQRGKERDFSSWFDFLDGLHLLSLEIIPTFDFESVTYGATVTTPLGVKSGSYTIMATRWMGWLPLFLPYPGIAEERTPNPTLPNFQLETKVRDKLVANLVSQFPKGAYERFVAEEVRSAAESSEKEKMRRAEARRLGVIDRLATDYRDALLGGDRALADSRLPLSEGDRLAGTALLDEFGSKFLPFAYATYMEKKEEVVRWLQVFNKEFPESLVVQPASPEWNAFNSVVGKLARARAEYFIYHDYLCYYWVANSLGALGGEDFLKIDSRELSVDLLSGTLTPMQPDELNPLDAKTAEFAAKYAPDSNAMYQKMNCEYLETVAALTKTAEQYRLLDGVCRSPFYDAAVSKCNELSRELNSLVFALESWNKEYRATLISSDDVAWRDAEMRKKLTPFVESLPAYVRSHSPMSSCSGEKAFVLGDASSAEQGDATAQCVKGNNGEEQSWTEAARRWRKSAERGDADAQNSLGVCYAKGRGVEQSWAEAVRWYRKAAEQGNAYAQFNLGLRYANGQGVEQSWTEAARWLHMSAEQGNAVAQDVLGYYYLKGNGVERSWAEAARWFRRAAEQGNARAQYSLGRCYRNGRGVSQSNEEAVRWFLRAEKNGFKLPDRDREFANENMRKK